MAAILLVPQCVKQTYFIPFSQIIFYVHHTMNSVCFQ